MKDVNLYIYYLTNRLAGAFINSQQALKAVTLTL